MLAALRFGNLNNLVQARFNEPGKTETPDLREQYKHKLFNGVVPEGEEYLFYGGTFGPITNGHMFVGQSAPKKYSKVVFMPVGVPSHRDGEKVASPLHRLNMTLLATADNDRFLVSDYEVNKVPEKCYTIDSIRELFPDLLAQGKKIPWLVGSDALKYLASWKEPEAILKHLELVQGIRTGSRQVKSVLLKSGKRKKFDSIGVPMLDLSISGSLIRNFLEMGRSVKYLVPDKVANYLEAHPDIWQQKAD